MFSNDAFEMTHILLLRIADIGTVVQTTIKELHLNYRLLCVGFSACFKESFGSLARTRATQSVIENDKK